MKQFESFRLDTANECLWRERAQISIPPKPFAVLRYLVENAGRLISHDELLDALWPETYVQPQILRTYVLDLRKVLGDDASEPRFIQTLPKRGYCFVAAVKDCESPERGAATGKKTQSSNRGAEKAGTGAAKGGEAGGIVGRGDELGRLEAHLAALAKGERLVIFVCGEAGIGKTAVVDAFCRKVVASNTAALARGQCVQGIGGVEDYYPVMEALSHLCASPDGDAACRILTRRAPAWLTPGRAAENEGMMAQPANVERTLGDLCGALEEISAGKPLLLIFEDLEWADDSTLNLISALARRRAPARLMVVATCRTLKSSTEHPLKALKQDLLMRRLCAEVTLSPLGKMAVREMLSRELHQDTLPPGLEGFVYQRAEGNPLFVIAIVEHLISERVLVRQGIDDAARWEQRIGFGEIEAGVPNQLAQMIELEIELLSAEERSLLEAGSLMSVAFPTWAVAAALKQDAGETEEACDALACRLHFVERAGQDELPDGTRSAFYVFAHGLYREVIYQRQTATRRGRRHIRIAERLQELFRGREADVAREIAMHFEAGGDWQRAANALRVAAVRARQRHAYPDAIELLEQALRVAENLGEPERGAAVVEIRSDLLAACEGLELQAAIHEKA